MAKIRKSQGALKGRTLSGRPGSKAQIHPSPGNSSMWKAQETASFADTEERWLQKTAGNCIICGVRHLQHPKTKSFNMAVALRASEAAAVIPNAVGLRETQMSAKEHKRIKIANDQDLG